MQAYVRCHDITTNLSSYIMFTRECSNGLLLRTSRIWNDKCCMSNLQKIIASYKIIVPDKNKSYTDDAYIKGCWEAVEQSIEESYMLTIFGYGAPASDVEAVKLLKKSLGQSGK